MLNIININVNKYNHYANIINIIMYNINLKY